MIMIWKHSMVLRFLISQDEEDGGSKLEEDEEGTGDYWKLWL